MIDLSKMVKAWYMDTASDDQRLPHHPEGAPDLSLELLASLGVLYWKVRRYWLCPWREISLFSNHASTDRCGPLRWGRTAGQDKKGQRLHVPGHSGSLPRETTKLRTKGKRMDGRTHLVGAEIIYRGGKGVVYPTLFVVIYLIAVFRDCCSSCVSSGRGRTKHKPHVQKCRQGV